MPKPRPASTPSRNPADVADVDADGSRATNQIAGNASAMPIQTTSPGRSPIRKPVTTGTNAAPTPETGATTPIRPVDRPR